MTFIERIEMIERVHLLISRKATGTPEDLARKLNISKRAVFDLIQQMKDMGAPIEFNNRKNSYLYISECECELRFKLKNKVKGGMLNIDLMSINLHN